MHRSLASALKSHLLSDESFLRAAISIAIGFGLFVGAELIAEVVQPRSSVTAFIGISGWFIAVIGIIDSFIVFATVVARRGRK